MFFGEDPLLELSDLRVGHDLELGLGLLNCASSFLGCENHPFENHLSGEIIFVDR